MNPSPSPTDSNATTPTADSVDSGNPSIPNELSVYGIIQALKTYWNKQGCTIYESYDIPMGAGTFHPATLFSVLSKNPKNVAFAQACRRPADARYGENPNRLGRYFQFQVVMSPSPLDSQELYLNSLKAVGIDVPSHDIRFLEDNWESPTLGASGLGYEVWCDGMEVSQYTYFQEFAGVPFGRSLHKKEGFILPVPLEITYGVERLAMFIQGEYLSKHPDGRLDEHQDGRHLDDQLGVNSVYDLVYSKNSNIDTTYGSLYHTSEVQWSTAIFEDLPTKVLLQDFKHNQEHFKLLMEKNLYIPAYDYCLMASHTFNLLDASGVITQKERPDYIAKIRAMAKQCATAYVKDHS